MLTQQQAVPPIVHFKALHPLVTGLKTGAEEATRMGHTYNEEVNVRGFPALFPMAASPLAGTSALRACPAGVSAFGFGGTMAHVIVDGQPHATVDRVRAPLRYVNAVSYPWQPLPGDNPAEKFQARALSAGLALARGATRGAERVCAVALPLTRTRRSTASLRSAIWKA
jgi:acyl transferase domain-containing protein